MWYTDDEERDGDSGGEESGGEAGPWVGYWRHLPWGRFDTELWPGCDVAPGETP